MVKNKLSQKLDGQKWTFAFRIYINIHLIEITAVCTPEKHIHQGSQTTTLLPWIKMFYLQFLSVLAIQVKSPDVQMVTINNKCICGRILLT
jgi:hypothetical protein